MQSASHIQYFTNSQIDKAKWDACIDKAANGLIYAYSFYLDLMSANWDAVILNDYETVMPLTFNKKYGIGYLYQPMLTAQLGVFGNDLDVSLIKKFLDAVPLKFKYWDIYLNHKNLLPVDNYDIYERVNYILDLNKKHEELYNGYRENIKRNIKRAQQAGCYAATDFNPAEVIQLAKEQINQLGSGRNDFESFTELYNFLHQRQQAVTYGIFSAAKQLLASCVFFFSHQRAYYILVGNHPDGKTIGASHMLIDAFIKDHAGENMLLDFEGSDISNLAFFYSSFGAVEEKYAAIKLNRLPFYLRWVKK
jgi:Acetyltransferase (GNAT) domain